jgi:hypothetical protein
MPSLVRDPLIEEQIYDSVVSTWEYISYTIRQLIKFLPCLWAGYERGRRKEEKMRKAALAQKKGESGGSGKLVHRALDVQLEEWTRVLWANLLISLDNLDELRGDGAKRFNKPEDSSGEKHNGMSKAVPVDAASAGRKEMDFNLSGT